MNRREFLRNAIIAGGVALAAGRFPDMKVFAGTSKKYNVILILMDDLGYTELGCYKNKFNESPNLDKLAVDGVLFTDAYSASPVCSPTRASLMSGEWPHRTGITDFLDRNANIKLPDSVDTIAELLRADGYETGIIGKWHLSPYSDPTGMPDHRGFNETMVVEQSYIGNGDYFYPYKFMPDVKQRIEGEEYLIDRVNLEAVDFIKRNKDRPFFLYVSHYAVHTVLDGRPDLADKYSKKKGAGLVGAVSRKNNPHLAAMVESVDDGIGMIMSTLKEQGIDDNTIVIFTSDNGGDRRITPNTPLREGKSHLYEGGIRVPLIVRMPGDVAHGAVSRKPVSTIDFFPTIAEAAGITKKPRQPLDGISLMPIFKGTDTSPDRKEPLFWDYPRPDPHSLGGRMSSAVRQGDWKLIEFHDTGESELYNLSNDIPEKVNLAEKEPAMLASLKSLLRDWRARTGLPAPAKP